MKQRNSFLKHRKLIHGRPSIKVVAFGREVHLPDSRQLRPISPLLGSPLTVTILFKKCDVYCCFNNK